MIIDQENAPEELRETNGRAKRHANYIIGQVNTHEDMLAIFLAATIVGAYWSENGCELDEIVSDFRRGVEERHEALIAVLRAGN